MTVVPMIKKAVEQLRSEGKAITKENVLRRMPRKGQRFVKMAFKMHQELISDVGVEEWLDIMISLGDRAQEMKSDNRTL